MSLQWIGAILIVSGCGGIGFLMALNDRRELDAVRQLRDGLEFMICQMGYQMTPLPELCAKVSGLSRGSVRALFAALAAELESQVAPDVACCMTAALSRVPELPAKAGGVLSELGHTLGQFDLQSQIRGLEGMRERCDGIRKAMEANQEQRLRSYQTLGLCAGAAIAILFL